VLRWVIVSLFLLGVFPLVLRDPVFRWYLHHGGDQDAMYALAQSILGGAPIESVVGIGQALVMIPCILVFKPFYYIEIATPLVVINAFLLGGLSVPVMGGIAYRALRDEQIAVWAAVIWAMLPLLGYLAVFWHPHWLEVASAIVPTLGWLNGLSDGPALLAVMAATWLLLGMRDRSGWPGFWSLFATGAMLGVAVIFRIHFATVVVFFGLYILVKHGWEALAGVAGAAAVVYLPQAWYNQMVFGIPITTGYISYGEVTTHGGIWHRPLADLLSSTVFHPRHLIETLTYFIERRWWLSVPLAAGLLLGGVVLAGWWRKLGWETTTVLIITPLVYLTPMVMAWNFREDIVRFLMPLVPSAIIAGLDLLFEAERRWRKKTYKVTPG
jgi:hypothetical protein